MAASWFRTFTERLLTANRAPELGDFVRLGAQDARQLIGPETVTFINIWFPYVPADGLAQVIAMQGNALDVVFWGRAMRKTPREAPYRPLKRFALNLTQISLPEIKDFNALCDGFCFKLKAKRSKPFGPHFGAAAGWAVADGTGDPAHCTANG